MEVGKINILTSENFHREKGKRKTNGGSAITRGEKRLYQDVRVDCQEGIAGLSKNYHSLSKLLKENMSVKSGEAINKVTSDEPGGKRERDVFEDRWLFSQRVWDEGQTAFNSC